jgi:small neutral amino acid transporter SnatA (MarC family)
MNQMPWAQVFGLLFMTMGPIRAIAVFGNVGDSDADPDVRSLANRAAALAAGAYVLAVLMGNGALTAWGVSFPVLIGAAGCALFALSLQSLLNPAPVSNRLDPSATRAAAVAFPGLFPPIAVTVPLIFSVPYPGIENKLGVLALGLAIIALNWVLMRKSKAILSAVGPVPLLLFGAVFGVLQLALGLEFMVDAAIMLLRA